MSETRRFPWGLTLAVIPALALLIALGVWQLQRLHWKEGLIARAEAAAALPPVDIERLERADLTDFRRIVLVCPGLSTAPFVELQSIRDGQAGVRLVSPCRVERLGGWLLVDRGFVPDTVSARPAEGPSERPVTIEAQVRLVPGRGGRERPVGDGRLFLHRDEAAMAAALGVGPVLASAFATTSSNPDWAALEPSAPPPAFANNHLGYALTWFGLAIALAGVYGAMMRKRMSR